MKKIIFFIEIIIAISIVVILSIIVFMKINDTKDSVEISKAAQRIATLIKDVDEYYINYNRLTDVGLMTKVDLDSNNWFFVKYDKCLHIDMENNFLVIRKIDNPKGLCDKFLKYDAVNSLLVGKESTRENAKTLNINSNNRIYIKIGDKNR